MSYLTDWLNPLWYMRTLYREKDPQVPLLEIHPTNIQSNSCKSNGCKLDDDDQDPTYNGWVKEDCPTVMHLIIKNARTTPDKLNVIWLDGDLQETDTYTYREIEERIHAIAYNITAGKGLKRGDRALLVFLPDASGPFITSFLGCILAGVIPVPIYPPSPSNLAQDLERMSKIVDASGAKIALTTSKFKHLMVAGRMKMALSHGFQYSWPSSLSWVTVDKVAAPPASATVVDEYLEGIHIEDVAFLQFTSGSTGFPKGVMVSHSNLNHNIACQLKLLTSKSRACDLVMVGWLPLYHDFGLISGAIFGSASGGMLVGQSPLTFLRKPLTWLEAISKYNGTHTGAPNFALARCVKTWKSLSPSNRPNLNLRSLQALSIGAEPVQPQVLDSFRSTFMEFGLGKDTLQPCYGLAEHVVFLTSSAGTRPEDQISEDGFAVSGVARYGIDVKIVNHRSRKECDPGVDGEIWVSSPSVCRGYWNMFELSKEVFEVPFGNRKYLRTGDLGRLVGGLLYVTGRLKDVIIVGGENHYPQDIEQTVLGTHPLVRPGRVAAFSLGEDRIGLVVELNCEKPEPTVCQEIFQRIILEVRRAHKLTVSRIKLIKPRSIPRTTSGKIQRQESMRSLLEGKLRGIPSGDFDAGTGHSKTTFAQSSASSSVASGFDGVADEEAQILGTICNVCVLSPEDMDTEKSLSDNGVTSMQAFAIVGSLESLYPGLDLMALMRPTPILELVKEIVRGSQLGKASKIKSVPIQDVMFGVPLSFGQEQMAIIQQLMPDSSAYNVPVTIKLTGRLNVSALQKALEEIIERHWILSVKLENRSGELVQVLDGTLRQALNNLKVNDIRHIHRGDKDTCQSVVDKLLSDSISEPFDLFKGPVTRVMLIRASNLEHILVVMCHHAIVDGWSMRILSSDLCQLYNACVTSRRMPVAPTQIKFHDYAAWQRRVLVGNKLDELLKFWKENLKGAPRLLELPTDKPRKQFLTTAPAGHVPFSICHSNLLKLKALSANHKVTLFTTLLSIFNVLLGRYSGQSDVVVGTPFAGRTQAQFMKVVGYIANPIALRTDLSGNPRFCDLLQRCRDVCLNAFEHSAAPICKVVGAVGAGDEISYAPIFQVMFNLQQMSLRDQEMEMAGCKVETLTLYSRPQESRFDLSLELIEEQSSVNGFLEYSTDLFEYATAQRMTNHFSNLIDAVVEAPEYTIGKLRMLSIFESRDLERQAKEIKHEYKIMNVTLHELIHIQATRNTKEPCLLFRDGQMSYRDVEIASNQLANYLISLGVGANKNVGIMAEKSNEMVIAILGILKAGGAYTPIDPTYPSCRIAHIVEDADIQSVIVHTLNDAAERITSLGLQTIHLSGESKSAELGRQRTSYPENRCSPSDVAYTIFTSGSTGRPKGVMITHKSVVNFLEWMMREFKLTSKDRYLQNINFTFDLSMMEIFLPLTSGALLVLPDPKLHPNPTYVVDLINTSSATFCCSVPSVLRRFVETCQSGDCRTMRTQICCGEVLPTGVAAKFIEKLPFCTLANTYGPTEATIHVTSHIVTTDSLDGPLSIGRPICNVSVYIVDQYLNPCSVGVPGELMISGACLAKGYASHPELTREKFIRNPFAALSDIEDYKRMYRTGDVASWNADGTIRILGRSDNQVKVRGFRIEMEEVERGIHEVEGVDEAVASVRSDPSGDLHLVAYVVPESLDTENIKNKLGGTLPHYMVPSVIIPLRSFPSLPNGKIDREALPEPVWGTQDAEEFVVPRNEIERQILLIWKQVLGVEDISIHSDFFRIGGDSLKAGLVAARIQDLAGVKFPGILVFKYRTVGGLAKYAIEKGQKAIYSDESELELLPLSVADFNSEQLMDGVPVSFTQKRMLSLYDCDKQGSAYNVPMATRLEGPLDPIALKKSIYYLTARHKVLAMRYRKIGDRQWLHAKCDDETTLNLNVLDLTYMSTCFESDIVARAMEILREDASKSFLLYKDAPIRITLIRIGENDHLLMLCMHHVACDGISIGILATEFVECYNALGKDHAPKLTHRPLQYYDYSMWQATSMKSGCFNRQFEFWREQLKDLPTKLLLHVDPEQVTPRPGTQDSFGNAGYVEVVAPASLVAIIKNIGYDNGATLFMVILSAFNLLLSWVSDQTDVVVGVPYASGRMHEETEQMLGCFVNPLPIRIDVSKYRTFLDLLCGVRDIALVSFENGEAPLDKIIDMLGLEYSASLHPIYQVVLVLQETEAYRPVLEFQELQATPILHVSQVKHSSQFVTVDLVETPAGVTGSMWYNADLFSEDQVSGWVVGLVDILKAVSSDPQASLESLRAMLWSAPPERSTSCNAQMWS